MCLSTSSLELVVFQLSVLSAWRFTQIAFDVGDAARLPYSTVPSTSSPPHTECRSWRITTRPRTSLRGCAGLAGDWDHGLAPRPQQCVRGDARGLPPCQRGRRRAAPRLGGYAPTWRSCWARGSQWTSSRTSLRRAASRARRSGSCARPPPQYRTAVASIDRSASPYLTHIHAGRIARCSPAPPMPPARDAWSHVGTEAAQDRGGEHGRHILH